MKQVKNASANSTFPGFAHTVEELSAFHLSLDSFVISLKNGELVRFSPENTEAFLSWLKTHRVKDIR